MSERRHGDTFTILRLVAAFAVILGHAYQVTGEEMPKVLGNGIATLAVKVFFVISGYLVTDSWLRDASLGRYIARRVLRILPGLWVLCLLSVLVVGPAFTTLPLGVYVRDAETVRYLENMIFRPQYHLPGLFEDLPFAGVANVSLWTLPIEFALYLAVPLLLAARPRFLVGATLLLSAAAGLWLNRIAYPQPAVMVWGTDLVTAVEMVPYFLSGCLYRLSVPKRLFNLKAAIAGMLILPLFAPGWTAQEVVCLILLPYAVLSFGFAPMPLPATLGRIGDISYGIYLYGFLIQQAVQSLIGSGGTPMLNFCLSAPIAGLVGLASWHWVERPALAWKPRPPAPTVPGLADVRR